MRSILRAILPAIAGSTLGFVVHQLIQRRSKSSDEPQDTDLVVASPLTNALIGVAVGAIAGRRAGFLAGFAVSAAAGTRLDEANRALDCLRDRLGERAEPAAGEQAADETTAAAPEAVDSLESDEG
jgi:hypothetical protein